MQPPRYPPAEPSPTFATGADKGHAGFWRQCRGQGHVFVTLVRHTERKLLALGQPIQALGQQAQQLLAQATDLQDTQRSV